MTFKIKEHKNEIENEGMMIAPLEVACHFSHERPIPEIKGITPFMFHKWDGDNVQYPRFGDGYGREIKRLVSMLLIKLGVYDQIHRLYLKR